MKRLSADWITAAAIQLTVTKTAWAGTRHQCAVPSYYLRPACRRAMLTAAVIPPVRPGPPARVISASVRHALGADATSSR